MIHSESEQRSSSQSHALSLDERNYDTMSLESTASNSSMLSWVSLSSPHCFVPESLFKVPTPGGQVIYLPAMMLTEGSKIMAADGVTELEVVCKVEQQSSEITMLQAGDSIPPLYVTPSHRIIVPEVQDDTTQRTVRAEDLQVGDSVVCSAGNVKQLTQAETFPEDTMVFALSFRPDEAVEVFLPPPEVILSMGQASRGRRTRRSGMNRRAPQSRGADVHQNDQVSIPDTAPGAYQD